MDEVLDLQERAGVAALAPSGSIHGCVSRVHAVFKTHLDVGFTDTARSVIQAYFTDFIPRALDAAACLRRRGGPERLSWTTGSWLIYEFLEQATAEQRRRMDEAIAAGDVSWHALPLTFHSESMDACLFRFGLRLSAALDRRYGRCTIAAKMTDVPGHTRAIVPLLAEAGVKFLHIGVNPACPQPDVPPLFRWRAPCGAEIAVMYNSGYGVTLPLDGLREILAFSHRGENSGPPSTDDVILHFESLRDEFPNAEVLPSTMDRFAVSLEPLWPILPVVTSEIGDSWIHGVGSDPAKSARFRALCRLRNQWETADSGLLDSSDYARFSRILLLIPEHTWGKDEKTHLAGISTPDDTFMPKDATYEAEAFAEARRTEPFRCLEQSWQEQRDYIGQAVAELTERTMVEEINRELRATEPAMPDRAQFTVFDAAQDPYIETTHFTVALDPASGALRHLARRTDGRVLANPQHLLGLFRYEMFSQADYDRFLREYNINMEHPWCSRWAVPDFSKPGIDAGGAVSRRITATCTWSGQRLLPGCTTLLARVHFADELAQPYGPPDIAFIEYRFPDDSPAVHVTLQWFDKRATRLPEALWLSFMPVAADPASWMLDKMGTPVSPLDVVRNGNRNLHAVTRGVFCGAGADRVMIRSLDVPLVAPGEPRLLRFDNTLPPLAYGMHFNLLNNVWGTNFPMWYEDDGKCRFVLQFEP